MAGALVLARRRRPTRAAVASGQPVRVRVAVRLVGGVVGLLVLASAAQFNTPGNPTRAVFDTLGARWQAYSQQRNYLANGFVTGVLYNLDVPPVPVPAGYSAARMARIAERYRAAADRINATRDRDGLTGVNVVMVLSESFSDPTALHGVHVPHDPIPFTRRLMHEPGTVSGSMLAQGIGGGTANMEFEALTGMSASGFPPQLRVPYQMVVPRYSSFPSVVRWAKATGHRTVALHPFSTEMYRRREVYRTFGFDEFRYDDTMRAPRRIGHDAYISDASAFEEVDRTLRSESAPVFMNVVTMQNHLPYTGRYDDPEHVSGPDGKTLPDAGQYVRGLEHSDAALRHPRRRPACAGRADGAGLLRGPPARLLPPERVRGEHRGADAPDAVLRVGELPGPGHGGPTSGPGPSVVSPTHFVDLAAERAGAAVTPYYALLTELRAQVPGLEDRTVLGPGGHRGAARAALAPRPAAAAGLPARAVRPLGRAPVRPDGPARAALSGPVSPR